MKIYLAAPYQRKDFINLLATELRKLGLEVTSSWLNEPHSSNTQPQELTEEKRREYAIQDVIDIRRADIFVLFTDPSKTITRAGRHVEFGIALERGMPIYVIGSERENLFHYYPGVMHFADWNAFLDRVL